MTIAHVQRCVTEYLSILVVQDAKTRYKRANRNGENENKRDPKTYPCGTPILCVIVLNLLALIQMAVYLQLSKCIIGVELSAIFTNIVIQLWHSVDVHSETDHPIWDPS